MPTRCSKPADMAAHYISGYAIECALKACIARKTKQEDFPPREAARYYVHDIPKLLEIAGLGSVFEQEARTGDQAKPSGFWPPLPIPSME